MCEAGAEAGTGHGNLRRAQFRWLANPRKPPNRRRYLHNRNFVHGDLRSPNLFVASDGHIRIGDFGFCRMLAPETQRVRRGACGAWSCAVVLRRSHAPAASY